MEHYICRLTRSFFCSLSSRLRHPQSLINKQVSSLYRLVNDQSTAFQDVQDGQDGLASEADTWGDFGKGDVTQPNTPERDGGGTFEGLETA